MLLALATVATAWAAYQSRQWTGEQSQGYSRATATRIATRPFSNAAAAPTPFAMGQYRLASSEQADRLEAEAALDSQAARNANQRADNYMLAVVLFASSLFFAGISMKLASVGARVATLAIGCILFLGTAAWVATLPTQVTV